MRSDRVFDALQTLRNRYMLCQLASKATRKFHRPSTRIQETMNGVLVGSLTRSGKQCCRNQRTLPRHNGGLLKPALPSCLALCIFPESPPFENLPLTLSNTH